MKIYFGGSIRAGREDMELYTKLIEHLKNYGEVLSEHVGDHSVTHMGSRGEPREIYLNDMAMLNDSDVVVAEVTTPSLGVGYEISKAEERKRVLCLYKASPDKSLSAMISGNPNITLKNYSSVEEAKLQINEFLKQVSR